MKVIEITTQKQWDSLPIGTKFSESFGSGYRTIRAEKVSNTHYSGVKCYYNEPAGEQDFEFTENFREDYSEIETVI